MDNLKDSQFDDKDLIAHFFALSLDLFCVANDKGYFLHLNPAWEVMLGYTSEELVSRPYVDFVHPEDLGATVSEQKALTEGRNVLNFENRYRAKDGSWKWLAWKASPQPGGLIFAVARDITEQKEERRLTQELIHKIERINHELDQFAHIVSHDLKSPLRAVMSLSEFIVEDLGDNVSPEVLGHVKMLKERVLGMNRMIEDLLKFARVGNRESASEEVDLNALLFEMLPILIRPATYRVILPELLHSVNGRWVELNLLFQNLLANSIKYRKSDDGFVKVTQTRKDDMWLFSVQDDGIGIPARHHERVFQLFQRAVSDSHVEGTGLGLALVMKIVNAAGGKAWLDSEEGKGTTVWFTWPL